MTSFVSFSFCYHDYYHCFYSSTPFWILLFSNVIYYLYSCYFSDDLMSFQRNLIEHEQVLQVVLLQFLLCLYSCGSESLTKVFLAVLNFLFTLYILLKRHTPALTSPGKLVLIGGLSVLASMNAEFKFSTSL